MRALLARILTVVGGIVVLLAVVGAVVAGVKALMKGRVPARTLLEVNLEGGLLERLPADPLAQLMLRGRPTLRSVVDALEKAGDDPKVTGLVATLGAGSLGIAQAQEVRDAVLAFRAKKKTAVAFAETFGEFGPGNGGYYLATAFDEIYLQPSGDVGLTGIIATHPFLRGTLDKLGVVPRMDHRYEYKNAMNLFTEKKFTPAHKEATSRLLASVFGQMVKGIAEGRKLGEDEVKTIFDNGPYLGQEAVDAKLVDGLAYRDEVYEKAKSKAGKDAKLLFLGQYLERAGRPHEKGKTVALVYGVGGVSRGKDDYDPLGGSFRMGSDTVAAAFRDAVEDKDVKAILFRVDSPGGSYVASDTIWRETVRAKKAGKPVIVSMGDVAASGGYFVSMAADKIVAQPGTITASIGVLGGKMLTSGLWDKVGLGWDEVHTSANGTMWTDIRDYTPAEWARFQAMARPDLRGLHEQGRGRSEAAQGEGAGDRQGQGVDGRGRQGAGTRGRAGRPLDRAPPRQEGGRHPGHGGREPPGLSEAEEPARADPRRPPREQRARGHCGRSRPGSGAAGRPAARRHRLLRAPGRARHTAARGAVAPRPQDRLASMCLMY